MSVYANNISKKKPTKKQRLELAYLTFTSTAPFRLVYKRVWMSNQYFFFALVLPWNLVTHFENSINNRAADCGFGPRLKKKSSSPSKGGATKIFTLNRRLTLSAEWLGLGLKELICTIDK